MSIPRICTETVTTSGSTTIRSYDGRFPIHPTSCIVTEELNGEYELEMTVESTDKYFHEIKIGRIIMVPHDSTMVNDFFEIYNISNALNGIAHVSAWHVTYRTNKMLLKPFTISQPSPYKILQNLSSWMVQGGKEMFVFSSNITTQGAFPFEVKEVSTIRKVLKDVADEYGGEFKWSEHQIQLLSQRGKDSDIILRYGVNIMSMDREQAAEDAFVGVYPLWSGKDENGNEVTVTLTEEIVTRSYLNDYYDCHKPIIPLDLSKSFESKPTVTDLRTAAITWLEKNAPRVIPENIDVSVLQMDDSDRASVASLALGDTLTIFYKEMGINVKAKVTKTVFNVLLDRYDSLSIGTMTNTMNNAIKKVVGIK